MASSSKSGALQDFGDGGSMTRAQLQNALKAWKLPFSGPTEDLRERYRLHRNNSSMLSTPSASSAKKVPAAKAKSSTSSATKVPAGKKKPSTKTAPPQEKRLKRFRSSCPNGVMERIARALTQRMFLVQKGQVEEENLSCKFVVLGSTGNVYEVKIQKLAHCTCPDHQRRGLCKHILFVLLKVMAIAPDSPLIYQAAWLDSELRDMFDQMNQRFRHVSGAVLANSKVRETFAKLEKGEDVDQDNEEDPNVARRQQVEENDDCPICFDALQGGDKTTFCRARCGANFHQGCIQNWLKQHRTKPTCPMCREAWDDGKPKGIGTPTKEGFTNLGELQGQSQVRDTSTYSDWYGSPSSYRKRRRRW